MSKIPFTGPRLPLLLGLAALLATGLACASEADVSEPTTVTPETVERYRTGVVLPLQEVDAAIAALETTAQEADSVTAAAYGPALEVLRRERQRLQAALEDLHGLSPEAFEEATATVDARLDTLEERVALAPVTLALNAEQLRQAAQARLQSLDAEIEESPPLQRAQAELLQRRQRIEGALARLGSPEVAFTAVRAEVARLFAELEDRLDALRGGAAPTVAPTPADTLVPDAE